MFQPLHHRNELAGYEGRAGNCLFFFGTRHCSRAILSEIYPTLTFSFLKQVHGSEIVPARADETPAADGHFTLERHRALVIQTADCLPVLLAGREHVLALHAGWRGLAKLIIKAAAKFGPFEIAAIGPHIRAESFEVGLEVARELEAIGGSQAVLPHPNPEKRFVDLSLIATQHLRDHVGPSIQIIPDNTFLSPLFHSYRRGKEKSERQYSFIARL